jgi:hypothetical protein
MQRAKTHAAGRRHSGRGQGERHRRTTDANGSGPEFTLLLGGERRGLPGLGDAHHDHCTKDVRLGGLTSPRPDLPHSSAPPVESTLPCPKQKPSCLRVDGGCRPSVSIYYLLPYLRAEHLPVYPCEAATSMSPCGAAGGLIPPSG